VGGRHPPPHTPHPPLLIEKVPSFDIQKDGGERNLAKLYYALPLISALYSSCRYRAKISEDFQDGLTLEGIRFVNPFAEGFEVEEWV